jgi:molybdopterin converting factor small subunit
MKVLIPGALRTYTGEREIQVNGATLAAVIAEMDRRYPGIRFRMIDEQDRMRRHVRFFVNGDQVYELSHRLGPSDELIIVQALSGG